MTTRESLASAELAYQQAPRATSEPARLARLAAVREAIADGWTHAAIADAMGKSRGWVSQRAKTAATVQPSRRPDAVFGSKFECPYCGNVDYVSSGPCCDGPDETPTQHPVTDRPRAIDRFRKG